MTINTGTVKQMTNAQLEEVAQAALNVWAVEEARLNTPISDMDAAIPIFDIVAAELTERVIHAGPDGWPRS